MPSHSLPYRLAVRKRSRVLNLFLSKAQKHHSIHTLFWSARLLKSRLNLANLSTPIEKPILNL